MENAGVERILLNDNFIDDFLSQRLIHPLFNFFFLIFQFMFERSDAGRDDQFIPDDLELVCIAGNCFSHDLFPHIFYLQCLDATLDTAFFQKLIDGIAN